MPSERSSTESGSLLKPACASALLNTALMALQIAIGLAAHSDGLLADGIHTQSDLAADSLVLIVLYATASKNRHKPRTDKTFPDSVAPLLIAALLTATAIETLWHSIMQTGTLTGTAMQITALAVAALVTITKERLFRYLRAEGERTHSAILLASAWHARLDAASALVATLGMAGSLAGIPMLDHVAGAAIGLMILRMACITGWNALKERTGRPLGKATGQ